MSGFPRKLSSDTLFDESWGQLHVLKRWLATGLLTSTTCLALLGCSSFADSGDVSELGSNRTTRLLSSEAIRVNVVGPDDANGVPGGSVTLRYSFNAPSATARPMQVFVHFRKDGQLVFTGDHFPVLPTDQWSGNVTYTRAVRIPSRELALGTYTIDVGLYDNSERLPLHAGAGVLNDPNDGSFSYQVGSLTLYSAQALQVNPSVVTAVPGQTIGIQYRWFASEHSHATLATPREVFVHFIDKQQLRTQFVDNFWPRIPSTEWSPQLNQVLPITLYHETTVPGDTPEGEFTIAVGLWDNGPTRFPLSEGPGVKALGDLRYAVGTLAVRRIEALQVSPVQAAVTAGGTFDVTYNWHASMPAPSQLGVFVHFVDPSGQIQFQDDHAPPLDNPTNHWSGNVHYSHTVKVGSTVPPGVYRIMVGLVDANTGERVPLAAGPSVAEDSERRYFVGKVVVNAVAPEAQAEVRHVEDYCEIRTPQVVFDKTCISNALAQPTQSGKPLHVILPAATFELGAPYSPIEGDHLSNVMISGQGSATVIRSDGIAFHCHSCRNVTVRDIAFTSVTRPIVLTVSELPTLAPAYPDGPNTIVELDRMGTGQGYVPGANDCDLFRPAPELDVSIRCAKLGQCLSDTQWRDDSLSSPLRFDTGVSFDASSNIAISGLSGRYYTIMFTDSYLNETPNCNDISVVNNQVHGARNFAGISFWRNSPSTPGCSNITVANNEISYATNSGITLGGVTDAVIDHNYVHHCGENGIWTWGATRTEPVARSSRITIANNTTQYNFYDGLELSSSMPHNADTARFFTHSGVYGNESSFNVRLGLWSDAAAWDISGNRFVSNGFSGMDLDVFDSTITGNYVVDNNTRSTFPYELEHHQVKFGEAYPVHGNQFYGNVIENPNANAGACVFVLGPNLNVDPSVGVNQIHSNICQGASIVDFYFDRNGQAQTSNFDNIFDNTVRP